MSTARYIPLEQRRAIQVSSSILFSILWDYHQHCAAFICEQEQ